MPQLTFFHSQRNWAGHRSDRNPLRLLFTQEHYCCSWNLVVENTLRQGEVITYHCLGPLDVRSWAVWKAEEDA